MEETLSSWSKEKNVKADWYFHFLPIPEREYEKILSDEEYKIGSSYFFLKNVFLSHLKAIEQWKYLSEWIDNHEGTGTEKD